MKYYFAPLEGITGYVYRNAHHKFFPGTDRYYTPFVAPNYTKHFKTKEKRDVAPENNAGVPLVPQVLSNKADETLWAVEELAQLGYEEINLNLGCPMPTVARKKKGSGLLKFTDELDAYLDGVFEGIAQRSTDRPPVRISVKTRVGTDSTQEAEALVRIYNRYPISELIVHPRSQKDLYKGIPDREAFLLVWQNSVNPIVYNGNLNCAEDVNEIARVCAEASCAAGGTGAETGKQLECVMAGRGFLADPSLVRQCQGGELISARELEAFHAELYERLSETLPGSAVVLSHMKELWYYMGNLFPEGGKCLKEIRRAGNRVQYEAAVRVLLSSCRIERPGSGFWRKWYAQKD